MTGKVIVGTVHYITACLQFATLTQMYSALRNHAKRWVRSWASGAGKHIYLKDIL